MKLNKRFAFITFIVIAMAIMLFVVFGNDKAAPVFAKPLTAKMTVEPSSLTPVGTVTAEELDLMRKDKSKAVSSLKSKATIAITYTNNSNKKLENVKIRFKETKTTDPNNFILYGDTGVHSYTRDAERYTNFVVYNAPPKVPVTVTIVAWAQHPGSSEYEAEVVAGDLRARANNVIITAK